MDQAQQVIERAQEAVQSSHSPLAEVALQQAMNLMDQAHQSYQNRNYVLAHQLSQKAMERAQQAIAAARQTEENSNSVLNKLEQVEQLMERVNDAVDDDSGPGLTTLVESARTNLDRAWEFYRSNQLRAAWKMANQVESTLRKIFRAAETQGNVQSRYEHRLETTKQIMERAEAIVANCESENAQQLMQQAKDAVHQAEELGQASRYGAALKAMQQARSMTEQAIRNCQGGVDLNTRLERLTSQLSRLREQISTDDAPANQFIQTVSEQLQLAREMINQDNETAATAALRAAQLSLRQLERYLNSGEI